MKLLTFLVREFQWEPFSQTIAEANPDEQADSMENAVVAFIQVEEADIEDDRYKSVFRKTLKHLKWLANKRDFRNVVLHSFTHLGGKNASFEDAQAWLLAMAERLENTGYEVKLTPFGWFSSWKIDVLGESLAKVWKEF